MDFDAAGQLNEDLREFLIESNENLANLDREIVELERTPEDQSLISGVFRTIHTIKGTCGFFDFNCLGSVAHITENILCQVREERRPLTPELISLVLEAVDKIKAILVRIESTGKEGEDDAEELRVRLNEAHRAFVEGKQDTKAEPPKIELEKKEESKIEEEETVEIATPVAAVGLRISEVPDSEESPVSPTPWPEPAVAAAPTPAKGVALAAASGPDPAPAPVLLKTPPPAGIAAPAPKYVPEAVSRAARDLPDGPAADAKVDGEKKGSEKKSEAQLADSTIRVDVGLLNKLMNLVGELVLARNQLVQETTSLNPTLLKTSQRLNLITSELQEGVMKTRMQPIGVVWNKLPRVVRDLAAKCGKTVQIEMEGAGTELDKTIIEAIKDPLTHIVRNSCDHGIELPEIRLAKGKSPDGLLLLRAYHEGGVVNIEISDDGAGMNCEVLKRKAVEKGLLRAEQAAQLADRDARHLIFMPGFSTAAQVTSISGRGVGMDVVKTNIEKIGGSVDVLEREPYGTIIRIKIPLTLAIIPGLVVSLEADALKGGRDQRFVVPQANLLELVRLEAEHDLQLIKNLHGTVIFHHRGNLLPLVYLSRVLGKPVSNRPQDVVNIVVVQAENSQMGLVVDHIRDTQEIVVKPLGRQLKSLTCYVGATIMGDGHPALILDVAGLARLAGLGGQPRHAIDKAASGEKPLQRTQMLLLFRAGSYDRLAVPLSLVARLEEIETAKIERAAGRLVLHYRGDILPLVSLSSVLEPHRESESLSGETAQVIVFTDGTRRVGVVVDQIVDIVNEAITVRRSSPAPGLLGSAVIGGKITDLLDLHAVVDRCGENWLKPPTAAGNGQRLLLLDPSIPSRDMIAEYLAAFGYEVLAANSIFDALPKMRKIPIDLVIATVAARGDGGLDTLRALRRDQQFERIPVLGLMEHEDQMRQQISGGLAFDAQLVRSDRGGLLNSVAALVRAQTVRHEVAA